MSLTCTKWKRHWYLCNEFKNVCKRRGDTSIIVKNHQKGPKHRKKREKKWKNGLGVY